MGSILDGKALSAAVRDEVKQGVASFAQAHGRPPGLTVVLVGDDPASVVYTRNKESKAREVGIAGVLHRLPADTPEAELLRLIRSLNDDPTVDGILVQLPLPRGIRADAVLDAIDPAKDVDGLHPMNAGLLASGRPALVPCTPAGCARLLREAGCALRGARAVVVGRSNLVGKPMAQLLLAEHATVTLAHSQTRDLGALCREAEVLVVAAGKAGLVRGDWVREGAVVIDVGTNRGDDGKLVGDVVFDEALPRASRITPVPGGVGPMTIAMLLANTLRAAKARVLALAALGWRRGISGLALVVRLSALGGSRASGAPGAEKGERGSGGRESEGRGFGPPRPPLGRSRAAAGRGGSRTTLPLRLSRSGLPSEHDVAEVVRRSKGSRRRSLLGAPYKPGRPYLLKRSGSVVREPPLPAAALLRPRGAWGGRIRAPRSPCRPSLAPLFRPQALPTPAPPNATKAAAVNPPAPAPAPARSRAACGSARIRCRPR